MTDLSRFWKRLASTLDASTWLILYHRVIWACFSSRKLDPPCSFDWSVELALTNDWLLSCQMLLPVHYLFFRFFYHFIFLLDSYFWNLPFASVRQCKFVMDKVNIPEEEWTAKRASVALLQNTTFPALANSSRKVSRLGFRLICSSNANTRQCLFWKTVTPTQQSWMTTRCCVLPGCYDCCGAIGCMALTAGPCGWMLLSINSTKLDPKKSLYKRLS